jgi:hypothetical protein
VGATCSRLAGRWAFDGTWAVSVAVEAIPLEREQLAVEPIRVRRESPRLRFRASFGRPARAS